MKNGKSVLQQIGCVTRTVLIQVYDYRHGTCDSSYKSSWLYNVQVLNECDTKIKKERRRTWRVNNICKQICLSINILFILKNIFISIWKLRQINIVFVLSYFIFLIKINKKFMKKIRKKKV